MSDAPDAVLEIRASEENGITTVAFEDNGCGIQDTDMKKVFEPFYTTKEIGKGTGLGLSICARIMEKFHGGLSLDSTPGAGTTFTLRFPTVERDDQRTPTSKSAE